MAHIAIDSSKSAAYLKQSDYQVRGISRTVGFTYLSFSEPFLVSDILTRGNWVGLPTTLPHTLQGGSRVADGERYGMRGRTSIPRLIPIQACGSGGLCLEARPSSGAGKIA